PLGRCKECGGGKICPIGAPGAKLGPMLHIPRTFQPETPVKFASMVLLALAACGPSGCKSAGAPDGPGGGAAGDGPSWRQKPAPEFKLEDAEGREVSLSSLRGKPVLLNFWGIDCPYCEKEVPSLVRIDQRYRDAGLVVLGVNVRDAQ